MNWVIALILALPLLGALVNLFFVRRERAAGWIASAAVGLSFVATVVSVAMLATAPDGSQRLSVTLWSWISLGSLQVPFGLLFDPLTAVMTLLVTGVGGLIHVYSVGYMHGDVRPVRFFVYMNLFVAAMLLLVMADNLLVMFIGWEGVGLCSFLLIGHWFDRRSVAPGIVPSDAAVKAFVVNRIGDAAIILAMILIFSRFGTLNFYQTGPNIPGFLERAGEVAFVTENLGLLGNMGIATAIGLLLLIGVMAKSSQMPLYVWLTDAMAGPTPTSALIHAATMVTAGVYLIARTHTIFNASPTAAGVVVAVGVVTALAGATAAVAQTDIKRVLAYSTVSQLGYMVTAVGLGAYAAGMFHLLTHGLFKALLFLAAGAIIHGAHEVQDMRRMGGLREKFPTTFRLYLVGALALAGIFPLAGFWSKDEIIGYAWFTARNPGVALTLIVASLFTAYYMGRQVALIFFGKQRDTSYTAHEAEGVMLWPMVVLAFGAVIGGIMNLPGIHWLSDYLKPTLNEPPAEFTLGHGILATVTVLLSAGMGYLGWWLYARRWAGRVKPGKEDPMERFLGDIWRGSGMGWGLDWLYERGVVRPYRWLGTMLARVFDREGIDEVLVEGPAKVFGQLSRGFSLAQNGFIRSYTLLFLIGVLLLLGYIVIVSGQ